MDFDNFLKKKNETFFQKKIVTFFVNFCVNLFVKDFRMFFVISLFFYFKFLFGFFSILSPSSTVSKVIRNFKQPNNCEDGLDFDNFPNQKNCSGVIFLQNKIRMNVIVIDASSSSPSSSSNFPEC